MSVVAKIVAFVLLLGGLVFFHELGHFLTAKLFRVKVLRFSLGFGPKIWGFRRGETEYVLAALPLGGYVKMAGEDPTQPVAPEDKGRGFAEQKPYRRALIAFAGPAVNLILPPLVFGAVYMTAQKQLPPVVGVVIPGEPAEAAGVRAGDRVVQVDGQPTRSFDEMKEVIESHAGQPVDLEVDRDGRLVTLHLTPAAVDVTNPVETRTKGRIGIIAGKIAPYVAVRPGSRAALAGVRDFDRVTSLDGRPIETNQDLKRALADLAPGAVTVGLVRHLTADVATAPVATAKTLTVTIPAGGGELGFDDPELYVADVRPGSAAFQAGLRPHDKVVSVNGAPVESEFRYEQLVQNQQSLDLGIERGATKVQVKFAPGTTTLNDKVLGPQTVPDYGFSFDPAVLAPMPWDDSDFVTVRYGPAEALRRGFDETVDLTRQMVVGLVGIATGRLSDRLIGGPIQMYQLTSMAAEQGFAALMKMFALISINLGLLKLVPLPVLDGFHILVSGIEGVSRRTVPLRVREIASYVGLAMLALLMILAFRNDIARTFFQNKF